MTQPRVNTRPSRQTRFIFVTGGVMSSLGKGLTAASLGAILQARGFSVIQQKLDPYLNVDPGTMSPFQHGEVYVTDDGCETDLDLGHYERFTGVPTGRHSNITTGQIMWNILEKERRGDYLGATVQVVPHVTNEIKDFILQLDGKADFALIEIGGTVGDIESPAFFEAIRQFAHDVGRRRCLYMHLTYAPYLKTAGEVKTKPTQHAVRSLLELGIQADVVVVRADNPMERAELDKIARFSNVPTSHVVCCPDSDSIYRVPVTLFENGLDTAVLDSFGMDAPVPDLSRWRKLADLYVQPPRKVRIAVVGKYVQLGDSYKSLNEALIHGGFAHGCGVEIDFVDSELLSDSSEYDVAARLKDCSGILVPGGFGYRGTEGKIKAIQYARENDIPYFGICLGMQLATVEFARNCAGLKGAGSTEFAQDVGQAPAHPVIALMNEWQTADGKKRQGDNENLGGTMRLGAYKCSLKAGTKAASLYPEGEIMERHRHRYEFNNTYKQKLADAGLMFSGVGDGGVANGEELVEMIELPNHPWFVAAQFHPEFKSQPLNPHPLFAGFVGAALAQQEQLLKAA